MFTVNIVVARCANFFNMPSFYVRHHSRMSRSSKILIFSVGLVAAVAIALPVLAYFRMHSSSASSLLKYPVFKQIIFLASPEKCPELTPTAAPS